VVVEARNLQRTYDIRRGMFRAPAHLRAVGDISFRIERGRTLAVVGESGCGKSTLARMVALIEKPTAGHAHAGRRRRGRHAARPQARAAPGRAAGVPEPVRLAQSAQEDLARCSKTPLAINTTLGKAERAAKARDMLARVGLRPEYANRYPHMFSGGQRQRIAIARALMLSPRLVVADEPVSALDVSIQAQVLNLLADLQAELGLAYLFISHDLGVVRHIAHDVLVMYLGHVVEQGPKSRIFARPLHPYTQALLASTPGLSSQRIVLQGRAAVAAESAGGLRVQHALPARGAALPRRAAAAARLDERQVACHFAEQFLEARRWCAPMCRWRRTPNAFSLFFSQPCFKEST
jgi:dipeptide transport system ATP-binding protein